MWSRISYRFALPSALLITAGAIGALQCFPWFGQARAQSGSQPQPAPPDGRDQDRAAVRAALDSFVKAFESRDAKALAAHWTAGGEYHSLEGVKARGRDALEKGFEGYFARTPELKAKIRHEELHFLSTDSATEEGFVTVQRGPLEPAVNARFSALLMRENGQWRMARLSESPGPGESIEDLAWLVGEWKSTGKDGADIQTTYSWHPNKKFLQAQFTIKEKSRTFTGSQLIGVDPATGTIHSWTFEADGGVGEANWRRDGNEWIVDADGTLTDGRTLSETNILRKLNDNTFTWQSTSRALENETLADLPPVKVTRLAVAQ
jgi:uncharacterized protein (TIGR02246 family)